MKDIVLSGESGTKLYPITGESKQFLMLYDKSMIQINTNTLKR